MLVDGVFCGFGFLLNMSENGKNFVKSSFISLEA